MNTQQTIGSYSYFFVSDMGGARALHLYLSILDVKNVTKMKQAKMVLVNYVLMGGYRILSNDLQAFYNNDETDNVGIHLKGNYYLQAYFTSCPNSRPGIFIAISGKTFRVSGRRQRLSDLEQ